MSHKMSITSTIARTGATNAKIAIIIEEPVSTVETIGFAIPPVVAVDANRVVEVDALIADAVPPPAIIANDHVIKGSKSAAVDNITAVPANAANGTAIVSNKLSSQGIKYAIISTKVAIPKVINAGIPLIHCQFSFNGITP